MTDTDYLTYRIKKLEAAVAMMNHHLPMISYRYPSDYGEHGALCCNDLPASVRAPLMVALTEAARYAANMFREENDTYRHNADKTTTAQADSNHTQARERGCGKEST